jgi:hypothetical protein
MGSGSEEGGADRGSRPLLLGDSLFSLLEYWTNEGKGVYKEPSLDISFPVLDSGSYFLFFHLLYLLLF